ncbi:MAG: Gx transporter family protein [Defluviitaleaceae bacterium]|nr:Gx transporter family protein [Defluviitaleaceae bacterium]
MPKKDTAKRIAMYGVFSSLAIIMAYIERLFPMQLLVPIPFVKLGLANIVVVMALYAFGVRAAFAIAVLRIGVVALLFGNPFSFAYSLAGGMASFAIMVLVQRTNVFGVVGVSVFGGVVHGVAQLAIGAALVRTVGLFYYSPVMIIAGVVTGMLIGYTAGFALRNIKIIQRVGGA